MSNWTHVAGVIRVDSIRAFDGEIDFDKKIGKECLWTSDYDVWNEASEHPERFMPMGSGGSLRKTVWENPDRSHMAAYTITIFGDLRDHDDPDAIIEWFKSICSNFLVRNAVIVVENECNGKRTWNYCFDEDEEFI